MTYYKISEITEMLKVSDRTVRRWIADGKLNVLKTPGGHLLISREEIDRILKPETKK